MMSSGADLDRVTRVLAPFSQRLLWLGSADLSKTAGASPTASPASRKLCGGVASGSSGSPSSGAPYIAVAPLMPMSVGSLFGETETETETGTETETETETEMETGTETETETESAVGEGDRGRGIECTAATVNVYSSNAPVLCRSGAPSIDHPAPGCSSKAWVRRSPRGEVRLTLCTVSGGGSGGCFMACYRPHCPNICAIFGYVCYGSTQH